MAAPPRSLEQRLEEELGDQAEGTLVALDERTGDYVVAPDLDALVQALSRMPARRLGQIHIFRLGPRAAIELRRR